MVIESNKDIDRYQESVALGLTAKQLLYSLVSLIMGSGIVLLLQKQIGLTLAAYVAVPVVAPIALQGFYRYNGMSFIEVMKKRIYFAFLNRAHIYVSEEGEAAVKAYQSQMIAGKNSKREMNEERGRYSGTFFR